MAQSTFFRNYSVEDGLPFINVSTIFQDSKGNLWSGGYGGLSKFDGIAFTNFATKDGLLNHFVTTISEDNEGNLWIGTISGINKYDSKTFSGYTTKNGLINNSVTSSLKDSKGNIWFGTEKGISKLTEGTFINFSKQDGLVGDFVKCLFQDREGKIWIGTTEGISIFNGKTFTPITTANGLLSNSVTSITQDKENNFWIGTTNGICKISNNNIFTSYTDEQGMIDNNVSSVLCDYKNTIWIGTGKGLMKFVDGKFTRYSIKRDQNSNLVSYLYEDFEHNLWIGTYSGLFKYRGNPFTSYGIHDGLTSNFIFGITRDSKNNLWVGSQGGGLFLYEDGYFTQFNKENGLDANMVNMIYEYSPGVLWLGTDKGLTIYDGKKFTRQNDTSAAWKEIINCIYKDSKNNIWLGSKGKIFKYDGEKFIYYPLIGLSDKCDVWTFVEDKNGVIWAGSYLGGLFKLELNTFVECSKKIGLKNDTYLTSLIDEEGNLYFGALDGLWMIHPNRLDKQPVNFGEKDGMSSDLVYSLTFGLSQNEIWVGTNQGINKLDITEYKKSGIKNIIQFGKQEGFSGVECNSNGTFVDKDGAIWFGTVYGVVKYDPNEYIPNPFESRISISKYRLFYKDTVFTNNMHLHYDDNSITFSFSGICLTNPSKVKYSHILEGFEKNWSPPSKDRFTTYSNLPPGTYTFKVISSNNEGIWNKIPATFTFTIDRPFWKTWAFIIFTTSFFILALIFSIRFRIRRIKNREKRKTELNKKIANIESQALRAQMNPHFIFNTLSSIQHYISNNDTDAALKYLSKFAKLMRRIMDNSKQQMISVSEEINALELYLELETMRFDKKFIYTITIDKEIDQTYDRIPSMLIQPYVENAIIHGLLPLEANGKISIIMEKQNDTIMCIIEDNGIGREKSKEFKKNRVQQHKSMGMSITKERLDILNSSLNSNINAEIIDVFENGKASGTKVRLIIPLDSNEN
ncbi:MAG TPA: two-component regulator propeller domain-containing protein [Bacteroidia bacterium]|nr:two-component regulator propeller domain-containing protein [Bacteroidia bacterium]